MRCNHWIDARDRRCRHCGMSELRIVLGDPYRFDQPCMSLDLSSKASSLLTDKVAEALTTILNHRAACRQSWFVNELGQPVMVVPAPSDNTRDCLCGWKLELTVAK